MKTEMKLERKYNTRQVAEYGVSGTLIELIFNNGILLEENNIFSQSALTDISCVRQVELVLSSFETKNNDNLITELASRLVGSSIKEQLTVEIVDLVLAMSQADEDGFTELLVFEQ
jgi:hypothetical protein